MNQFIIALTACFWCGFAFIICLTENSPNTFSWFCFTLAMGIGAWWQYLRLDDEENNSKNTY